MIIALLRGRAGNQLFQYALCRHLAHKHGTELYFDISAHRKDSKIFILPRFNVNIKTVGPVSSILLRKIVKKRFLRFSWLPIYVEKGYGFDDKVLAMPATSVLFGYFQSEKYFSAISDIIRNDLSFRDFPVDASTREIQKKIADSNSVSVHVRRGDYLSSGKFAVCTREYYLRAMNLMRGKTGDPLFYFFSDDIQWCRDNFRGPQYAFVDLKQSQQDPLNDMRLMSLCRHNIIANSTYSWWGAWLNSSQQKIVIAPHSWTSDEQASNNNIICDGWLKIDF